MKIKKISDKFYDGGAIIFSDNNNHELKNLNKKKIIEIFEKKGVIIFRNFKIIPKNLTKFTDFFTLRYANDASRRRKMYKNKNIKSVDLGNKEMALHSEASFSPSWPEILWFYCVRAPKKSGFTTLSDGTQFYKKFSIKAKKFLLSRQILFDLVIPFKDDLNVKKYLQNRKKNELKDWLLELPGTFDTKINFKKGFIETKFMNFAVSKTRNINRLAFCNHLQAVFGTDPQIIKCSLLNGQKIPNFIYEEIKKISQETKFEIKWKKNDLCMIDNQRFMHGRSKIFKTEKREIINIQTLYASFGFGESLRSNLK